MSDEHNETPAGSTDLFRLEALRELLQILGQTDVHELLIERDGSRIHIKRNVSAAHAAPPAVPRAPGAPAWATSISSMPPPVASPGSVPPPHAPYTLKSPMVGTFRAAPSPTEPPFVHEGDELAVGSPVCVIESLGQLNRIDSDMSGRVQRILAQDGQRVEYGQPLMLLESV